MDVRKLINMRGDEIIYICKGSEAIEVAIRDNGEMCLNYLGPFDNHMSSSEAFIDIMADDNADIYGVFDSLYTNFLGFRGQLNDLIAFRYEKISKDVYKYFNDNIVDWYSEGIFSFSKNQFMIEPISGGYRVRFKKGKYLY